MYRAAGLRTSALYPFQAKTHKSVVRIPIARKHRLNTPCFSCSVIVPLSCAIAPNYNFFYYDSRRIHGSAVVPPVKWSDTDVVPEADKDLLQCQYMSASKTGVPHCGYYVTTHILRVQRDAMKNCHFPV